jgi:glycosyltransferase involved in cell wall biosynthesis
VIGLALISRNEEHSLPRLLASIRGAFDRVVLVDTGSTDGTVAVFEEWAQAERCSYEVGRFEWRDDFSAARSYADSLLDADWLSWADCDDIVIGAENLREVSASSPPHIAAWLADYDYRHDEDGNCTAVGWRERLVRRGHGRWEGRIHESQRISGETAYVGPEAVKWVHLRENEDDKRARDLRLLRRWTREEPENPVALFYLARTALAIGSIPEALDAFRRYLDLDMPWDERRAHAHRSYAIALLLAGRAEEALMIALEAASALPSHPDGHLALAEVFLMVGERDKAAACAVRVLRLGVPPPVVGINPLDYTEYPLRILEAAEAGQGQGVGDR